MSENVQERKTEQSKNLKPVIIAGIAAAVLLVLYLGLGFFFKSHFYIGSTINGVAVSMKSADGAYSAILDNADTYEIRFVHDDGTVENTASSVDLGVTVAYSVDDVASLLSEQSGFGWVGHLFNHSQYYTSQGNSYDAAAVKKVASQLHFTEAEGAKDSEDAYIQYDNAGSFEIVDEVYGNKIDTTSVEEAIIRAIENFDYEINLDNGDCYGKPKVCANDDVIVSACDTLNSYMNTAIHYDLGEGITEEIPTDTKAGWFTWDDDYNIDFDRDAIGEFVNSMGSKYNTFGKAKAFTTTSGEEITVPAGSFGWKIAYDGEIDAIIADLTAGEDVTRDFTYLYYGTSHGEHDYGDSYVEINLTEQHVYVYKDGEMVFDTACVTGNVLANHGTHTGCYPIAYKAKDATLRGEDYESHVNYWMPFNMGEGLHDATWRSNFGGKIYQGGGSHGCVNLPLSAAKEIYSIIDAGWPVLVFYTGDTEAEIEHLLNPQYDVMNYIAKLETVTLESEYDITYARLHYDALNDEQKVQVTNYDVLVNAEATLAALKAAAAEAGQ